MVRNPRTVAIHDLWRQPRHVSSCAQTLALVTGSAAYIRTLHGWRTVCALVTMTSLHPDAFSTALDALAVVARPPALAPPSFPPCLEAVMAVAERNASKARPEVSLPASRTCLRQLMNLFWG